MTTAKTLAERRAHDRQELPYDVRLMIAIQSATRAGLHHVARALALELKSYMKKST